MDGELFQSSALQRMPSYQLICFDSLTGRVLCYRRIIISPPSANAAVSFSVQLPCASPPPAFDSIRIHLLGEVIGIDSCQGGEASAPLGASPQERLSASAPSVARSSSSRAAPKRAKKGSIVPFLAPIALRKSCDRRGQDENQGEGKGGDEGEVPGSHFLQSDDECSGGPPACHPRRQSFQESLESFNFEPTPVAAVEPARKVVGELAASQDLSVRRRTTSAAASGAVQVDPIRNELALVRSKGHELSLDCIPVKRLRKNFSAASDTKERGVGAGAGARVVAVAAAEDRAEVRVRGATEERSSDDGLGKRKVGDRKRRGVGSAGSWGSSQSRRASAPTKPFFDDLSSASSPSSSDQDTRCAKVRPFRQLGPVAATAPSSADHCPSSSRARGMAADREDGLKPGYQTPLPVRGGPHKGWRQGRSPPRPSSLPAAAAAAAAALAPAAADRQQLGGADRAAGLPGIHSSDFDDIFF